MIKATEVHNKSVMDSDGGHIGVLDSIEVNSHEGLLEKLLVDPSDNPEQKRRSDNEYQQDDRGRYIIPTDEVTAVRDCVIVE